MKVCHCTLSVTDPKACKVCRDRDQQIGYYNDMNHNEKYLQDFIPYTDLIKPFQLISILDKNEIMEIVNEKIRERGSNFEFINKEYLNILINIIVDSIVESQKLKISK